MPEPTPDKTLDCSGLKCPMPLVKTNRALKDLQPGQVLEMISTDPDSILDLEAWSKQTLNELLHTKTGERGEVHFFIKKAG